VLKVCGLEESSEGHGNKNSEDFHRKELKKTFQLPKNVESARPVSFMTSDGKLVIEMPFKKPSSSTAQLDNNQLASMLPHIVDTKNGKEMRVKLPVPTGIAADSIHVMLKDRDLIVQCEERVVAPDSLSRVHVINRVTLPEHIQWAALKCTKQDDSVIVTAPLDMSMMHETAAVVEVKPKQQQQEQQVKSSQKKKPAAPVQDEAVEVELPIEAWPALTQIAGGAEKNNNKSAKGRNLL